MIAHKLASYKNATSTVQKTKQIVLLYEAAIRFMQQARQAIEEEDYEARFNLLQKVSNILMGLHSGLDFDKGGEIAEMLSNFYSQIDLRIVGLNRTNDVADLDDIINEIKQMRDAWAEIDLKYSRGELEENATEPASSESEGADFNA